MLTGLAAPGIVGLFVVVSIVLIRSQRNENVAAKAYREQLTQQGETIAEQGKQIARLTLSDFRCQYRLSLAVGAMTRAGLQVPKELLDDD